MLNKDKIARIGSIIMRFLVSGVDFHVLHCKAEIPIQWEFTASDGWMSLP